MRIIGLILSIMMNFSALADSGSFRNQDNPVATYIDKYKEIAQSEMHRVGIPASIKLAQGILESNGGRSTLAQKANNHFGIKCGRYWEGETFYREDDDYKNGELIQSCFRKFNSAEISYIAHSDFLTNPGSQYRYGFLFDLSPLDYVSWAKGLKSSGYATDPKYADKIISVIEKYQLYRFDVLDSLVKDDEAIAAVVEIPEKQSDSDIPTQKEPVSFNIVDGFHVVKLGETMASIADEYNMDVDLLYFQNRMPNHSQPRPGERVIIEGIINWGERRPKHKKNFVQSKESYLFDDGSMSITIR